MKKTFTILSWASIAIAIICALAIPYVTAYKPLFLVLLLANIVLPFLVRKGYGKPANPKKAMGPQNAVIMAVRKPETKMMSMLLRLMFTPRFSA